MFFSVGQDVGGGTICYFRDTVMVVGNIEPPIIIALSTIRFHYFLGRTMSLEPKITILKSMEYPKEFRIVPPSQ
ncbi:MAG: hypothetical protein R2879_00100 [Saprospiraceae bacterium]